MVQNFSTIFRLAESAADQAIRAAKFRGDELAPVVGEMMNALTNATHDSIKATVELAAELVGGPGFIQGHPMERVVRDVRAMHVHPLPKRRQVVLTGRLALGFAPVGS